MPHQNEREPQGVLKRFTGFLTCNELVNSAVEIAADPRFDEVRYIINDLTGVQGHAIGPDFAERMATVRIGSMFTNPNIWVALVATDLQLAALANVVEKEPLKGTHRTLAFQALAEARQWLASHPSLSELPPRHSSTN